MPSYPSVVVADGDGAAGWPGAAPYDRIIVTASARDLAPAWTSQLGDEGRLLVPLSSRGGPDGDHLAERLAASISAWESAGRPAGPSLRIKAYPASTGDHERAVFTIDMPHTRVLLHRCPAHPLPDRLVTPHTRFLTAW